MKKIMISVIALLALVGAGFWWIQKRQMTSNFAQDAVSVLGIAASELFERHPEANSDDIGKMIRNQHEIPNL